MKRKFLSVLFALVLVMSFGLVAPVPAAAQETLEVIPMALTMSGGSGNTYWPRMG